MILRKAVEWISRGVVLKRKLPQRYGGLVIYVSAEIGGLKYWKPSLNGIDEMLNNIADKYIKPGDVVWDVGANLGLFTLAASARVGKSGKTLSIEADIQVAQVLTKTARANADYNIEVLPVAVSSELGVARFSISNRARATNHLELCAGSSQTGGTRFINHVPTFTLDFLLESYDCPNFLKIDVEGAEVHVLNGAHKLIERARPKVLIEVAAENIEIVTCFFKRNNYTLFDAATLEQLDKCVENTVCIPN